MYAQTEKYADLVQIRRSPSLAARLARAPTLVDVGSTAPLTHYVWH